MKPLVMCVVKVGTEHLVPDRCRIGNRSRRVVELLRSAQEARDLGMACRRRAWSGSLGYLARGRPVPYVVAGEYVRIGS